MSRPWASVIEWAAMALLLLGGGSVAAQGGPAGEAEVAEEAATLGVVGHRHIQQALVVVDGGPAPAHDGGGTDAGPGRITTLPRRADPPPGDRRAEDRRAEERRAEAESEAALVAQEAALERASLAETETLQQLLEKLAEAEGARADIARQERQLLEETAAALAAAEADLEDAGQLFAAAQRVKGGAEADALLDAAIVAEQEALTAARDAMAARQRGTADVSGLAADMPTELEVTLGQRLTPEGRTEVLARLDELRAAVAGTSAAAAALADTATDRWYQVAEKRLEVSHVVDDSRLALLHKASDARRQALTGLTEAGRDNVLVALAHLRTTLAFHVLRRVYGAAHLPDRLEDPLFSGVLLWVLFQALVAVVLTTVLFRRGPGLYGKLRQHFLGQVKNRARKKLFEGLLALAEDAAPQAVMLLVGWWLRELFLPIGPEPELSFVVGIILWVLGYQLSAKLTHRLVLRLARRRHLLTVPQKLKVLRTVRSVMRFGFLVAWFLPVAEAMVGVGILYAGLRAGVITGGALLFFVLVRRWRDDIVNAYVTGWGESRLAETVKESRERWFGVPLAAFALLYIAARAGLTLAKDFVLGFEQTRKALAYVFQVRVERQAKERGRRIVDVTLLPEGCRAAFAEEPCTEGRLLVDRFDELTPLLRRLEKNEPVQTLVSGPPGVGVTTLLLQLRERASALGTSTDDGGEGGVVAIDLTPKGRWRSRSDCVAALSQGLGLTTSSLSGLLAHLRHETARKVLIIDEVERAFTRGLDGYEALTALAEIICETERTTSWVVAGQGQAVRFLDRTRSLAQTFDRHLVLGPWSEAGIRELLQKRQRATGLSVSFEDLLLSDLGDAYDEHVVQTELGYIRLLWTLSDGNPRVALHFWLRSLVPEKGGLRVQLHDAPSANELEVLPVEERFLLQAVVLHRALTPADLARATNLSMMKTRAHIARGVEQGFYTVVDDEVRITTHYWQSAHRFLRRKNLL